MRLLQMIQKFHREESGQDIVEYAMVLFAVALAALAASSTISSVIGNALTTVSGKITSVIGSF